MDKPLRVISIDGTRGAGKTNQIAMLSKHFKALGMSVSTLKMIDGDPIVSGLVSIQFVESFLKSAPNGLVIIDGSIARPIVVDIMSGMSTPNLLDKFKALTHAYERLDHAYHVASFLMVMDDLEECARRVEKLKVLTGRESQEISNWEQERDVISGMRFFNNHISSKNIRFQVLDIDPRHSIMDINKMIMKRLEEQYTFTKAQKDDSEW